MAAPVSGVPGSKSLQQHRPDAQSAPNRVAQERAPMSAQQSAQISASMADQPVQMSAAPQFHQPGSHVHLHPSPQRFGAVPPNSDNKHLPRTDGMAPAQHPAFYACSRVVSEPQSPQRPPGRISEGAGLQLEASRAVPGRLSIGNVRQDVDPTMGVDAPAGRRHSIEFLLSSD